MKFEASIEKIKEAIVNTDRIAGKNLSLPVLGSILIIASDKKLKLRSTNLSIGIEVDVPAKVEKDGVVAVRAEILAGFFSNLVNTGTVSFEQIENTVVISTKQVTSRIKTIPHEDFPTIPVIDGEGSKISAQKFNEGLRAVYYSAAISDIKPEIASIYVYKDGEKLVFVATDSFRLSEKKIQQSIENFESILIPWKNVVEIMRLLDSVQGDFILTHTKTQIAITDKEQGLYLTSRVIDGNFPDYRLIFPKEVLIEASILKQEFVQSLKLATIFSDKFNQITLNINADTNTCSIASKNNETGEQDIVVPCKVTGGSITASFNYKHFMDCFSSIGGDTVKLSFTQPQKPVLVSGTDSSFTYLIMPLNR